MRSGRGNTIKISRSLRANPTLIFDIVYNVEDFPTFMPNVTAVRVINNEGNVKIVEWDMLIDGAPLNWTEEVRYNHELRTAEFRSLEGAFSHFDGIWRVWVSDRGTELEVSLYYDLGLPEIEDIIGPVLEDRLRHNLDAMLFSIENQAGS